MAPRGKNLPEDAQGMRPGHPLPGEAAMSCKDVEQLLQTTQETVRTMVAQGRLGGYWHRRPGAKNYRYRVYQSAVEKFISDHGVFSPDPKTRRSPKPRSSALSDSANSTVSASAEIRVLQLQEVVRCQSAVIAKLRAAQQQQEAATNHLRDAERAQAAANTLVGEANDAYWQLVSLEGVPDNLNGIW